MNFSAIFFPALLILLTGATLLWLVSVYMQNASIVDIFWGAGFVALAWYYFARTGEHSVGLPARRLLVVTLATIWGLRLSAYLLWRNWGKPEDFRYRNFRQRYGAGRYWWISFFQVFLLQSVLLWLVSAPLLGTQYATRQATLTWLDGMAALVWLVGFVFEAGGDWQLARFKRQPTNRGKLLTSGFWRYTRHPNYFGDAAVWWGFALFSLSAGAVLPLFGAALMTILLYRISGVALLERTLQQSKPGYATYMRQTNSFFPWRPRS